MRLAIAPQRCDRRHAGGTGGLDVTLVVAHVDAIGDGDGDAFGGDLQRQRVRLLLGQRVAADQHRTARIPAELGQDVAREVFGLVGHDAPGAARRFERGQHRGHAVEQHAVPAQLFLVDRQEFGHQRFAGRLFHLRKRRGQHGARALGDMRPQQVQRHRRYAPRGAHPVGGGQHVRRAVQQRAVQVEQGGTREPRRRHGFTAQAR